MGIYIKGIDMPKNEDELLSIHIYPNGKVTRQFDDKCNQIAEAVEVTSPHGRLIDADKLKDVCFDLNNNRWEITRTDYKRINNVLFNFPTVIESER